MAKVTVEVEEGSYSWAVAMEAQGKRVQGRNRTTPELWGEGTDGWPNPTNVEFRLAPLSPVEELVAALKDAHVLRGCPARVAEALAAVEAEIAAKKAGG